MAGLNDITKQELKKIPLLKNNAGPRDGDLWLERLKEEFEALIAFINNNKINDTDWFRLEANTDGTRWFGKCWHFYNNIKFVRKKLFGIFTFLNLSQSKKRFGF